MNTLEQIKHNLQHGLPIDVEETIVAIGELEKERDELKAHCSDAIELINQSLMIMESPHSDNEEYMLKESLHNFLKTPSKQSLAEIEANIIEELIFSWDEDGGIGFVLHAMNRINYLRNQAKDGE